MTRPRSDVNKLLSPEAAAVAKRAYGHKQLRTDVLEIMAPYIEKLAALDTGYGSHAHEYIPPRGGWANLDTLENCSECLINFESSPNSNPSSKMKTSAPK